jgi:hypothetical protein
VLDLHTADQAPTSYQLHIAASAVVYHQAEVVEGEAQAVEAFAVLAVSSS